MIHQRTSSIALGMVLFPNLTQLDFTGFHQVFSRFYVAGQGVPQIANGAATAADWMLVASFISMAGLISTLGYDGSIYLMGWTGGYVLLALLLAPYLRFSGCPATLPN